MLVSGLAELRIAEELPPATVPTDGIARSGWQGEALPYSQQNKMIYKRVLVSWNLQIFHMNTCPEWM